GDERGHVDHRAAAALQQPRDPVAAAEVDAPRVHGEHAIPGVGLGLQDRRVVGGHDPGVVVENVDAAVAAAGGRVHRVDAGGVGAVALLEDRLAAAGRRLLPALRADVGHAHGGALFGEERGRLAPDPAGRAGDHRDLAVEPSHQSVATNTFLT